jgi:citrate synthase
MDDWVPAKDAAAFLGVKRETLYAYVSRGKLRAAPGPNGRGRLYSRSDLERVRERSRARSGHAPVAASALHWGEPVLDSAISSFPAGGHQYRGIPAFDLAKEGFEPTCELLWTGASPDEWPDWPMPEDLGAQPRRVAGLLSTSARPTDVLPVAIAAMAAADPLRFAAPQAAELDRARVTLRRMVAWMALPRGLAACLDALRAPRLAVGVIHALGGAGHDDPAALFAADLALVLSADHGLTASTFAARVVASTGADIYACLGAGLGALSGPRHGGMSDRVEALVDEAGVPGRAAAVVHDRLRRGEAVPGFGHRLYPEGDTRTPHLLAVARELGGGPRLETVFQIAKTMRDAGHAPASLDFGLVAVAEALGLRPGAGVGLFAVGRCAGWVAHVLEQRQSDQLLRPRARSI